MRDLFMRDRAERGGTDVLFAYADETDFQYPRRGGSRRVGTGILVTRQPIDSSVIEQAMTAVAGRPGVTPEDQRTIDRGHFHASQDSSGAIESFADVIRVNTTGSFIYHYREPSLRPLSRGDGEVPKTSLVQELMLRFGIVSMTRTRSHIDLKVEQRHGIGHVQTKKWLDDQYSMRERGIYEQPSIPALFPDLSVVVAPKTEPGLQVVDLLLWAVNRAASIQDCRLEERGYDELLSRLGLQAALAHHAEDGGDRGGALYIGEEIPGVHITYPAGLPVPEILGRDGIYRAWCRIESTLHLYRGRLPEHAEHLSKKLYEVTRKLANPEFSVSADVLGEAASVFLRLFDTVPVYDDLDPDDVDLWRELLFSRRMASLVLRKDFGHGADAANALARWRRHVCSASPEILGLEHSASGPSRIE